MKCLNTRGCYDKDAVHLSFSHNGKYIDTDNFCSVECFLIYSGEIDPPKREHQTYDDPERQLIHDIYIRGYGQKEEEPEKRGVKPGTQRGQYKKPKIAKLEKRDKERHRKQKQREWTRKHRERKKHDEIVRKQQLMSEGV